MNNTRMELYLRKALVKAEEIRALLKNSWLGVIPRNDVIAEVNYLIGYLESGQEFFDAEMKKGRES